MNSIRLFNLFFYIRIFLYLKICFLSFFLYKYTVPSNKIVRCVGKFLSRYLQTSIIFTTILGRRKKQKSVNIDVVSLKFIFSRFLIFVGFTSSPGGKFIKKNQKNKKYLLDLI